MKLRRGTVMVWPKRGGEFRAMTLARAVREGREIILCSECDKRPARYLDHFFPYFWTENRCDECEEARRVSRGGGV